MVKAALLPHREVGCRQHCVWGPGLDAPSVPGQALGRRVTAQRTEVLLSPGAALEQRPELLR